MAEEKVLVADDREDNLQFLTEYVLTPEGYSYITARDGVSALQQALSTSGCLAVAV